jgi:phospholipid/cholesterol/gamma-HCH transport system ATP-binding protein
MRGENRGENRGEDREMAIEIEGLETSYGGEPVLRGIDLTVRRGEILVILGASGSGKSTLLRCLVGLERPDAGRLHLNGVDLFHDPPAEVAALRERMGVAFQGGALFGSLTVAENIDLPLAELTRLPESTRRIVVDIKLALVGLRHARDLLPAELSGGMVKRAALARAMALDPDLLFCDEPSAGLDPITSAGIDELLLRLRDVFGVTLVVVTHELASAFSIADRIALLHRGTVRALGPPSELEASTDPVVRRFLDRRAEEASESAGVLDGLRNGRTHV